MSTSLLQNCLLINNDLGIIEARIRGIDRKLILEMVKIAK